MKKVFSIDCDGHSRMPGGETVRRRGALQRPSEHAMMRENGFLCIAKTHQTLCEETETMRQPIDRRQFFAHAAAVAGSAALAGAASAGPAQDDPKSPPIVDTHQHLWDLERFRLPWIRKESPLNRSFVMRDYEQATAGLNVVKAVYMEVDVDPKQQVAEAEYILDVCRQGKTPTVAAVISGRPASAEFRQYITRFKGNRYLKGVRQVLHVEGTPAGLCLSADFQRGLRVLDEMGLSFDLCMRHAELPDVVRMCEALPNLRFILDHLGNPDVQAKDTTAWRREIGRIAKCKNLVCKVSGIVAGARNKWTADDLAPFVNHVLDSFGPDRVMFGGDWPVCTLRATYREWVEALRGIVRNRSAEQQRKLFHDNAVSFYGLK
jgi:predicted TIM-barrel fold metal-dependent hydrolase